MKRFLAVASLGLALTAAAPLWSTPAQAWWGPYGYGYGWRGPVVVAPPVAYIAPPVVYAPPRAVWVRPYWLGGRYYPGHWRR